MSFLKPERKTYRTSDPAEAKYLRRITDWNVILEDGSQGAESGAKSRGGNGKAEASAGRTWRVSGPSGTFTTESKVLADSLRDDDRYSVEAVAATESSAAPQMSDREFNRLKRKAAKAAAKERSAEKKALMQESFTDLMSRCVDIYNELAQAERWQQAYELGSKLRALMMRRSSTLMEAESKIGRSVRSGELSAAEEEKMRAAKKTLTKRRIGWKKNADRLNKKINAAKARIHQ
jgi:hypothetical protein